MKKFVFAMLGLSLFITACSEKKEEKINNSVVVSQGSKPKSLDPNMYNEIPALTITEQIFNTLLKIDENGNVVPELAESYEYTTPTELIIKLKKGVKFHNGDTLTSKDVVFSINRMLDKPASRVMIDAIKKVEMIDDYTVKLVLSKPSSPLLFGLAHPITAILNEKDTLAKNDVIATSPMGTGPYKFIDWGSGEKIELTSFDNYFEGKPKIDNLTYRAITENSSRLAALETGEIDIAYNMDAIDGSTVEKNPKLQLISKPTTSTEYITFNNEKAPFDNENFRKAVNYALDKKSMSDSIFMGKAIPANSIVNPNVFGYSDTVKGYPYNKEKAIEYLKKSGIENPSFTLFVNDNTTRLQLAQIIQANLKEIGIDMTIETLEWGTYLQKTAQGEHQALLGGWVSGTSDADIVFFPLLHSSSHGGAGNRAFYTNKKLDKIIEQAQLTSDPKERKELFFKAQEILQNDAPFGLLLYKNENIGINKRVKGFEYNPTMMHNLKDLYIEK